ncbi:hypothetical protein K461DRAFT_295106 [Myriangium duriaei CBS 260.36]|uniref:Dynactin subunit 4 n=1 Tax=Myriangium duriaei CBS 260.36 TaxID=1168546 RepID=A0A9P4J233_9PEZI|nr:hypothetical protein K461DRAFT_295106 [Myriangium duriaei CBS 260.36]
MSISFPYTYIACPCSEQDESAAATAHARRTSVLPLRRESDIDDEDEEDKPVNPHSFRANFNLYPCHQLLFCDECQQIRCPRCWAEETTNWYCPSCLFEVPSSVVKTDGNRCTRNCYNCPICTSPLVVNGLDQQPSDSSGPSGPFFLACPSCEWSSLDVGIELSKPNKITEQLYRLRKPKKPRQDESTAEEPSQETVSPTEESTEHPVDELPENAFARLVKFYNTQFSESDAAPANAYGLDASYSSPSNLARIMQIYGGLSAASLKKSREKPQPMREALSASEGLSLFPPSADSDLISRLNKSTLSDITTFDQRSSHPWNHSARFVSDLWPVPALLKTKKSKRCRACRHILIRYDDRKPTSTSSSSSSAVTSMKYKIRLLAQNNIPRLSLRPFTPTISTLKSHPSASFALTLPSLSTISSTTTSDFSLVPGQTKQYLLVLTNPLFETVRITLATPSPTPGTIPARVTILCPTLDLGPDGDMWDSALDSSGTTSSSTPSSSVRKTRDALAGGKGQFSSPSGPGGGEEISPEAGKVWERGRNWAGVVVEVTLPLTPSTNAETIGVTKGAREGEGEEYDDFVARTSREGKERLVDSNVLEIPVLVRAEWEADVVGGEEGGKVAGRERREIDFWAVLGAGRRSTVGI